jgi:uncharacterized protein (TIGR03790 family)
MGVFYKIFSLHASFIPSQCRRITLARFNRLAVVVFAILTLFCINAMAQSANDPNTVLVVVNDVYRSEAGTNGKPASVYVGEHYAAMRNIPASNILHLKIPYAGYQADGQWHGMEYDANQFISYADYLRYIQAPIQAYLADHPQILYIVTTYGVPVMLADTVWRVSIDSLLTAMYSGVAPSPYTPMLNPYRDPSATGSPAHFADWTNPGAYRMCLVTRLDGPSAGIAAALVDKAIQAESTVNFDSGMAYFDYIGDPPGAGVYYKLDQTVANAYHTAVDMGIPAVLNTQDASGHSIKSGPNSSWVWGWYVATIDNAYSSPVPGAIASQATSYTCNSVRDGGDPGATNWCVYFLKQGFTATWGATGEPYAWGIATGDSFFGHFWRGYNFAEAAYLANPYNNWMMTFIGDPLYSPHAFAIGGSASTPPNGWGNLVPEASGFCLDVRGKSTAPGAIVQQWPCWNGANQQWEFTSLPDGRYTIRSRQSGLLLTVADASTANGAAITMQPNHGWFAPPANQLWSVGAPDANGRRAIISANSDSCLDDPGSSTKPGTAMQQSTCSGGPTQKWLFVPVN